MNHNEVVAIYAELLGVEDYCEQAESVAEVHGILCGLLCRDPFVGASQWVKSLEFEGEPNDARFQMVRDQLDDLLAYSAQMLNQIDTEFNLMLPDDEESISTRIAEMAKWCQGFLYGFSSYEKSTVNQYVETYEYDEDDESDLEVIRERAAKAAQAELKNFNPDTADQDDSELPESVEEILADITELSQADAPQDSDKDSDDESDEASYMEVIEYLHASVQLVFEEMAGQRLEGRQEPIDVDDRFSFDAGDDGGVLH